MWFFFVLQSLDIVVPIISITPFLQFIVTAIILGCTLLNLFFFAVDNPSHIGSSCFVIAVIIMEIYPTATIWLIFFQIAKFSFTLYSFINEMGLKERFE
ncbi:odorant receptor 7a-like [Rhagoletis pomonella]|uniref:odorant receptor 7a-like n=1 Tax=Rhagoletis pomonella TaxID=28610 RepID=UPI00177EFF17|nr:odorant receptor 7a-like [Rhagoletis pomonella]